MERHRVVVTDRDSTRNIKTDENMPVHNAITKLLKEYVESPFQYLRETSAQARLAELINAQMKSAKWDVEVPATVKLDKLHADYSHAKTLKTNRTQLEMKITGCKCSTHGITDVLILRAGAPVTLTCHRNGPADVVADIAVEDVEVAVEIKACPSSMKEQRAKCRKDVEKLYSLVDSHRHVSAHFVFLDKSVSIGELAKVGLPKHKEWMEELQHTVSIQPAHGLPKVAIWDIDPKHLAPRCRFYGPRVAATRTA